MDIKRKRLPYTLPAMEQIRCGEAEYLTFPQIENLGVVKHLMSTRLGGISEGIYGSMNLSYSRGDDPAKVDENFRRIAAAFGKEPEAIVCSDQTHTVNIRRVSVSDGGKGVTRPRDYSDVDGLITNDVGIILACFFADCVPLLIVDPVHRALGVAHSGWKGTAALMGQRMVEAMEHEFGSSPGELYAAVGPSICQDCYEVSRDVAEAFERIFSQRQLTDLLINKGNGKYQLDLWKANAYIMEKAGIRPECISMTDICTCCNPDYLFSHRASSGKRGNLGMFAMLL